MALGNTMKKSPELLNTLQELNQLVKFLSGNNLDKIISDIQEETAQLEKAGEESNQARLDNERSIIALNHQTKEHSNNVILSKRATEQLAHAKIEHDKHLAKIREGHEALAVANKELQASIAAHDSNKQALALREKAAADKQAKADAISAEYEGKLEAFRKLTAL